MGVPFLDLGAQYRSLADEIDGAMERVVESQQFVLGPTVDAFERQFAKRLGTPHAVGVASGTDALLLSLRALDLPDGSEVLAPSFTFFATAGAIWNAGLRPVFADVDERTFDLTPSTIEAALTERTRAIVVVHLYGQMADMAAIMDLAREHELAVVEDVAQAFGARQRLNGAWREAGTLGDTGAFSFFPTKILGGFGDGGMIVSEDTALADRIRQLRVHGGHKMYHHEMVGTNSRLDALQAAVLSAKLPRAGEWLEARRSVASRYDEGLADLDEVSTPAVAEGNEHAFNVYTIRTPRRDALREHLSEHGIGSNVYYPLPLHLQPCFSELGGSEGDLPVSERLAGEVLSLPIFPEMSGEQVDEVVGRVRGFHGA